MKHKTEPLKQKIFRFLQIKKCIINPQNKDNCFKWTILSRYVTGPHIERVNFRYFVLENKFDFKHIDFPTPLNQISRFEKNNNVSINIYSIDEKKSIFPL